MSKTKTCTEQSSTTESKPAASNINRVFIDQQINQSSSNVNVPSFSSSTRATPSEQVYTGLSSRDVISTEIKQSHQHNSHPKLKLKRIDTAQIVSKLSTAKLPIAMTTSNSVSSAEGTHVMHSNSYSRITQPSKPKLMPFKQPASIDKAKPKLVLLGGAKNDENDESDRDRLQVEKLITQHQSRHINTSEFIDLLSSINLKRLSSGQLSTINKIFDPKVYLLCSEESNLKNIIEYIEKFKKSKLYKNNMKCLLHHEATSKKVGVFNFVRHSNKNFAEKWEEIEPGSINDMLSAYQTMLKGIDNPLSEQEIEIIRNEFKGEYVEKSIHENKKAVLVNQLELLMNLLDKVYPDFVKTTNLNVVSLKELEILHNKIMKQISEIDTEEQRNKIIATMKEMPSVKPQMRTNLMYLQDLERLQGDINAESKYSDFTLYKDDGQTSEEEKEKEKEEEKEKEKEEEEFMTQEKLKLFAYDSHNLYIKLGGPSLQKKDVLLPSKNFSLHDMFENYNEYAYVLVKDSETKYLKLSPCIQHRKEAMKKVIAIYNEKIITAENSEDKKLIVLNLVTDLERIHPYEDYNCRTFCVLILNRELIRNGLKPSFMKDPNVFDYETPETLESELLTGQKNFDDLVELTGKTAELP